MKKVFTLILALAFGFGLKAQCPYTEAIDFTATDIHGTEVHLFDILDGGQAVLIDFFFTTCGPCQQATPKIAQSYTAMGCNMYDVFYMEIATGDSDAACLNWVNNYGIEYPTISGAGGGTTICNQYGIGQYPTVILIMPNHQIVIQDLWPISNAQTIISQLEAHGLQQHDCTVPVPTYDPQVALIIDEVTESSITATFTPNEDCASYYYLCATEAELTEWVAALGQDLPAIMQEHGVVETNTLTNIFDGLIPETEYAVAVLPVDPDGNYGEPSYEIVTTLPLPVYDETLTFSMDTVNLVDNQYETYWVTIYNNTAEDAIVTNICDEFGWLAFTMDGEDIYCNNPIEITIQQGESKELGITINVVAKGIVSDIVTVTSNLPDASFVVVLEEPLSVDENEASVTLFPNPANDFVTLKGESLGTVRVYNVLGQKVDEFEANDSELRINTTSYENGVYVVKAGEQTLRFVVKH
ncbi:MAG: redoxin domain-containing protein [Bacteroidales bacterium]|nr:redoxin domain-containing protein [Bacteroidales bacterium]